MDLDRCLHERRSCRDYTSKKISLATVSEIIEAGSWAPSAGNVQNWNFIVVSDEEKRKKLSQLCMDQDWMIDAPIHVIICNDKKKVVDLYPKRGELYASQHCAYATAFMVLKAESLGIGSCLVGGMDVEGVQRLLNIPEHVVPEMVITLGYPDMVEDEVDKTAAPFVTYFEEYGTKKADLDFFPLQRQVQRAEKKQRKLLKKGVDKLKKLKKRTKK
jgi:nitroreductase